MPGIVPVELQRVVLTEAMRFLFSYYMSHVSSIGALYGTYAFLVGIAWWEAGGLEIETRCGRFAAAGSGAERRVRRMDGHNHPQSVQNGLFGLVLEI